MRQQKWLHRPAPAKTQFQTNGAGTRRVFHSFLWAGFISTLSFWCSAFQDIRPNGCVRVFHYSAINTSDSRGFEALLPQRDHSVRDCADQPPGLGFHISSDFQRSHSRSDPFAFLCIPGSTAFRSITPTRVQVCSDATAVHSPASVGTGSLK